MFCAAIVVIAPKRGICPVTQIHSPHLTSIQPQILQYVRCIWSCYPEKFWWQSDKNWVTFSVSVKTSDGVKTSASTLYTVNKFWKLRCDNAPWPCNSFRQVIFGVNHRNGPIADYSFTTGIEGSWSLLNNFPHIKVLPKYFLVFYFYFMSVWQASKVSAMLHSLNWCIQLKSCSSHDWLCAIRYIYHCTYQKKCMYHKDMYFFDGHFPCVVASNSHLTH